MTDEPVRPALLLVVDDEEGMRDTLLDILEAYDFDVDQACNGQEAVDKVKRRPYNLVLMDVKMPVMDGLMALHLIRTIRPKLPVILMTAYADTFSLDRAKVDGATAIFAKPLKLDDLLRLIQSLLPVQGRGGC
jgi:CheY-like chemotaxis protein